MLAPSQKCRTICDLLAGHALNVLEPADASAVGAHLATCSTCRDEHDCLAAVAAHLTSLRDALARDTGRQRPSYVPGMAGSRHCPRHQHRGRGSARGAVAASLTLSQWVSRIAYVR
ncbi:zf-HC2 domain-containing protein [Streptomyces dangxiongensis]|uniref:Zf-HC2 domain-containing protein n=1 Tax=Streptomyces dangxiongensis TaxID=1442032 RepID=A0A3G2JPS9_9ACTN|nr:zf-HC2 domain-containing protein [Streptomyces dangxiongensis]AYN42719.1 zf-HC2 domain-containing protein [Streptomyces dangxiongensis]